MKSKKKSNYKQIIQKIQNVRKKNNNNWMDVLRISFKYSQKETLKFNKETSNFFQCDDKNKFKKVMEEFEKNRKK